MSDQPHAPPPGTTIPGTQWSPAQLNTAWFQLENQITPFNSVLSIPGDIFRSLDDGAKYFLANSFMQHTAEAVMFCRDGTGNDRYFLGNPRHFFQGNGTIMEVYGGDPFWFPGTADLQAPQIDITLPLLSLSKTKEKKIPRPPNAYILYRKERHSLVKEANPGITNNEISQVLGSAWNSESREVRQKYKTMADDIKKALFEAHPDYQYKPRKPSEKKRRTRRNTQSQQAAAHDDAGTFGVSSPNDNDTDTVFTNE